jgi:hypothetical protein
MHLKRKRMLKSTNRITIIINNFAQENFFNLVAGCRILAYKLEGKLVDGSHIV